MTPRRIPSLNWLRVFEAAARTSSFARAAEELHMSTSAISQQIKALETHLACQLFTRRAHSVSLTPAGSAYLPVVQTALTAVETGTENLFGRARQETLYVQSVLIFAVSFLPPHLPRFETAEPDITLHLSTGNSASDFRDRYADLHIVFGEAALHGRKAEPLMSEWLTPVAHPDLAATIDHPTDLLSHPLIDVATHKSGWQHVLDHLRLRDTAQHLFADNTVMAFARAATGAGIALSRAPASTRLQDQLGLVPCLPGLTTSGSETYYLGYSATATLSRPARKFRTFLHDTCSQMSLDATNHSLTFTPSANIRDHT